MQVLLRGDTLERQSLTAMLNNISVNYQQVYRISPDIVSINQSHHA